MALIQTTSRTGKPTRHQRWTRTGLGLCLAAALASCGGGSTPDASCAEGDLRGPVLASIGESIIVPRQQSFAQRAAALQDALSTAADTPEDEQGRAAAQASWREAIEAWQVLELMQVGPATHGRGGLGLRDRIYSWPEMNRCLLNIQTIGDDYDDPEALAADTGTQRGLWAIEYLLFNDESDNECSELNQINQDGSWNAMLDALPERRLRHAASLAGLVRQDADELVRQWSPTGDGFLEELKAPCSNSTLYGSPQEGLNEVSNALFYLDTETRDMKLGEPAGIMMCEELICPQSLESLWAEHGKENVLANLRGFQEVFFGAEPGTEALGFDDLLTDMGAAQVVDDMRAALSDAIAKTEAIPGSLSEALQSDLPAVEDAYEAVKTVTDILKTEVLSVLDLEAPQRAAGDND
jgi:predicted lipoprotein